MVMKPARDAMPCAFLSELTDLRYNYKVWSTSIYGTGSDLAHHQIIRACVADVSISVPWQNGINFCLSVSLSSWSCVAFIAVTSSPYFYLLLLLL